ncbi:DAK2 domain-containing protein [Streptomyces clavuligerus]|uniref:Putative dihydroxyacetone kinase subunit 2 n=3 Tax=Streptomyces clavuligerus TaxID=1901 RepID=E2Q1Q0_STRCL|nr:DAK2 domain-containing protein [Streptomyces clavuligerus]ANW16812.1 dihydroxyacetone kinase [Streptomyces clavuligerus]AXU11343.1 DAK2 domain-containing protein [Streptomyces clavuligerus]EFG10676.1 Putative dihydroxyacetone kinase subunit 2 [Streptomyces clavuligerus]MBY6301150.1 DAK2 domain-containing protein [Streptomyces clavuligerus]QCS04211.1 DAK2 domain-containing protein [Streptomyces clavuligerus]
MAEDGVFTEAWVREFARSVAACESELTALDQLAGDGDFGVNLRSGLVAAVGVLDRGTADGRAAVPRRPRAAHEPLRVLATAFLDEVGGTSGPLFGLLFQELAAAARADGPRLTTHALAVGTGRGLAAIRRVGGAAPGDKTLLDALHPAVLALAACPAPTPPVRALDRASVTAWDGVRRTAGRSARRGRASYLGERAAGVPDPGAVGVALFLTTAVRPVTVLAPFLKAAGAPVSGRP